VLPPPLYAASEELPWRDLLAVWRRVLVLAVGLVLASAAAVAAVAGAVAGIPASMAFVLGAVLASTDPVAVSALGRRLSLPPKVQALVQAESLFNDPTILVLFQIEVSFAVAGTEYRAAPGAVLWLGAGQVPALVAGTMMLSCIVWGFPRSAVAQRRSGVRRPSWPVPAVVSWAGTRGVVPLAAALSIPLTSASGAPLPQRNLIVVLAAAVIVISLV